MSTVNTDADVPVADEPESGPIPQDVLRRERQWVAFLLAAFVIVGVIGYLRIPTESDLMETASTHDDPEERVAAMNALIKRGYWQDRTFEEFETFMNASPPLVRQFIADMHGELLKPARQAWK